MIVLCQVFFLQRGDHPKGGLTDSAEHNRLTERIARAFCLALCPHLKLLKEDGMAKLGLRVTFDSQEVREEVPHIGYYKDMLLGCVLYEMHMGQSCFVLHFKRQKTHPNMLLGCVPILTTHK